MGVLRAALTTGLTAAWAASRQASVRAFDEASKNPRRAQEAWLSKAWPSLSGSAYGRALGLETVSSLEAFRRRAPVVAWDDVAPHVERLANGERDALTTEPVLVFERTSGSTAAPKRVPYTQGLLDDFSAATGPWLDDLFRHFPALFGARQYWSVSPAARAPETTPSGVRVGFEDDTEYFGPATRAAMRQLMAVPSSVARLHDVEAWRLETLVHLVAAKDLGFISVWNPSFLTLLFEALEVRWDEVLERLPGARRREVERLPRAAPEALWPSLQLISCWTDGWAKAALLGLRRFVPSVPLQGKGLLATEGVVSFPRWGLPAPVAAVTSHLLEFESLDGDGVKWVDELREGASYGPVLTTRGGLVRYRLPDAMTCVGHWRAVPMLRFDGRRDKTSDLRGEKLSAVAVEPLLERVLQGQPIDFVLLAPSLSDRPRYTLFLETSLDEASVGPLGAAVEAALLGEHHYRYCRDLGQLGPVEVVRVTNGRAKWFAALTARGLKLGDIKPSAFDPSPEWGRWLR